MVRGVRCLSMDETPNRRPPDRSAGCVGWFGDGADEAFAICAGTFFGLGMAGARTLDYPGHVGWPHLAWPPGRHTTCNGKNRPGKKLMTLTRYLTLAFLLIVSSFGFAADHVAADLPFDSVITNGHI